jgi:hypothetical protein
VSILQKSSENFDAVDLLMDNNINAPVIHCAYYSSLQLIIHFVYNYCSLTGQQIDAGTSKNGSHNFFINTCVTEIRRIDSRNASLFYIYFSQFKRKRREADYDETIMSEQELIGAKERVVKIRKFIKLIEDEGRCENIHNI